MRNITKEAWEARKALKNNKPTMVFQSTVL